MPELTRVIADILTLEAADAGKHGRETDSIPAAPATEAKIAAAEKSRKRKFHPAYRAFLKLHDGWPDFSWGVNLRSTAELTGTAYDRGYIDDMDDDDDDQRTEEVDNALVIGWSENDATLLLLTDKGEVLQWRYEVEQRFRSIDALIVDRLKTLREVAAAEEKTERDIAASWAPKWRAKSEAKLAKQLRGVLAKAPKRAKVAMPKPPRGKRPAAVKPDSLRVVKNKQVVAEVMQQLVLYLGAFPSADEVIAAHAAWAKAYPVKGKPTWMAAGDYFPDDGKLDEPAMREKLRVRGGAYGLRFANDVKRSGGPARYVLNVVGAPPTQDSSELPRASLCEVIVPVSEAPETLAALAAELLAILPVRSGHGGYAALIWDEDADPLPEMFAWCRRFFAVDVGAIEGWLPGAMSRLHGASWLTVLGPAFASELEHAKRLHGLDMTRSERGAIIRAGKLVLGDVQRGEFPVAIAEVEAAIAPALISGYDARGFTSIGGTYFDTQQDDLLPMRSHRATAAFVRRFLDPAAWLAPTPREQAEAWLAKLGNRAAIKDWDKQKQEYIPDFDELLGHVANSTINNRSDDAVRALEFVVLFEDAPPEAWNGLLWILDQRKELAKALAVVPEALKRAPDCPSIFHNAAWIVFQTGDKKWAMRLVEQAHEHDYEHMDKLRDDPDFTPLHGMAAWKRLFKS